MRFTRILAAAFVLIISFYAASGHFAANSENAIAAESPSVAASSATPPTTSAATAAQVATAPIPSASVPPALPKARQIDAQDVISYLGDLIGWYRQISSEARFATSPADTLFVADDRHLGAQALGLGFDFAHAQAALLKREYGSAGVRAVAASGAKPATANPANAAAMPGFGNLSVQREPAQAEVDKDEMLVQQLQAALDRASRRKRPKVETRLAAAKAELELAQSRLDAIDAMLNFEKTATGGHAASGLQAQIDELERSAPQAAQPAGTPEPSAARVGATSASGIVGRAETLLALNQKEQNLASRVNETRHLAAIADGLRRSLLAQLTGMNQRAAALATQTASPDITTINRGESEIKQLTRRHDLLVSALLPLSKQLVVLSLYSNNLERWRAAMRQEITADLRDLVIRLGGLAILLGAIFFGSLLWRHLTFRYVHDLQHRYQLLQLRRITVIIIVALVLLFDFANELGALATVMGFAAAGIAFTLQNVIMSLAGYFYLSGRFGIRVGDRVQITGVNGDVLEIGLFKMTLMELGNEDYGGQPTGRIAVFPNSIVFQSNGNFYKQLPGANFTWNELRLTLAPDCDFRLAEKRLVEVVNEVFVRYRDSVQREYRGVERELNVRIETPRPQSRLRMSANGIEIVIRYPVQLLNAVQTSDEIARRLIDAIRREPRLKLAVQGTPSIQNEPEPESNSAAGGPQAGQHSLPPPDKSPQPQASGPISTAGAAATAAAAAVGLTTAGSVVADANPADTQANPPPDLSKNSK
jgi:small-conductance mechanosensitive channel